MNIPKNVAISGWIALILGIVLLLTSFGIWWSVLTINEIQFEVVTLIVGIYLIYKVLSKK